MSLSREVAEAYIQVHGDMSPFRRDLEKAAAGVKKAAQEAADDYADSFGKRLGDKTRGQWQSIMDAAFTGNSVDWDRVIGKFDSKNLDDARDKIHEFIGEMNELNKLEGPDGENLFGKLTKSVNDHIDAQKNLKDVLAQQEETEAALSDFRSQWSKKYLNDLNEAHRLDKLYADDAIRYSKMWKDALSADLQAATAENNAWHARRRKTMEEAVAENEKFNRSFNGLVKNVQQSGLEDDFRRIAESWNSEDFSRMLKDNGNDFDRLRNRVSHVVGAMEQMGRVNRGNAFEITADLEDWITGQDGVKEKIKETTREGGRLHGKMSRVTAVFAGLFRASKGFREHLGGFAGLNVFGDMISKGFDFIHNLDRIAVKAAKNTVLLSSMASIGGAGLASLVTIAGDLGTTIGGLAVILPGFLVGAAIQAAVLKVALQDMGTVLADLAPAFHDLQDSISEKFWAQAEAPIRSMVKTLLPTLKAGLDGTATALGGVFGKLADALADIDNGQMTRMFDRMNAGIEIAGGAMAPLVEAFTTLGLAASLYFERFGQWIVDLSTQFNDFIQAAAGDGRLLGWIDAMIEGFKNIGRVLDGAFGIFNAINTAATAAGSGGLKSFADGMQSIAAAMQTAGAQTAITQLLTGMYSLTGQLGEALGKLGGPLQSIMPEIQSALATIGGAVAQVIGYIGQVISNPLVQKGVTDFTSGIATAVANLAPAITPFANSLGNVMTLLGLILVSVADIVTAFMVKLSPVLDEMSLQMQTLVTPLKEAVVNLIDAVTPIAQAINDNLIGPLVNGIRDQVLPAFNSMVDTLGPIAAGMVAALGPVLQAIMPLIPPIMELATTIGGVLMGAVGALAPLFAVLIQAIAPVIGAINGLVQMIAPYLVPAIEKISAAVSPVIAVLGQVVGFILSILVPILGVLLIGIINNVVGVFQGLSNFIMGFVQIVTAIFTGFGAFFTKLFQGDFVGALTALGEMFKGIWDGIVQMLSGALEFLWNAVQLLFIGKLIGGIKSALTGIGGFFKGFWDDIVAFFKIIMQNLPEAVRIGFTAIKTFISTILGAVKSFIKTVWDGISSYFKTVLGNIKTTVTTVFDAVKGFIRSVWDSIRLIIRYAWEGIVGFVKTYINTVKTVISTVFNAVKTFIKTVWDGALAIIKNVWSAIVTGVKTYIGNLKANVTTVFNALKTFISTVWNAAKTLISNAWSSIVGTVRSYIGTVNSIVRSVFSGVQSFIGSVWQGAIRLVASAWNGMVSAVRGGITNVVSWVQGIGGRIQGALGNMWNLLTGAGEAIMRGLKQGLENAWGGVMSFVGGIADWIRDHKGPLPYDRRLLVPAGQAIMGGLESALKDKFGNVMDFVGQMADLMAGNFDKSKMYLAGADASQGLADGLLANKSKIKGAYSDLGQLSVADPTLGAISTRGTDGRTSDSGAAGTNLTLENGAIQIVTRASDPKLVQSSLSEGFDEAISVFSKL